MNAKPPSAFNAKTRRCQDGRRLRGRFHAAEEFLTGFRYGPNSSFLTPLPLCAFALSGANGRYIEVRLALIRDNPAKQPVLYDLTLHGLSSSFLDWYLDDAWAYETENAEFVAEGAAPEPLTYQWWVQWPWMQPWDWTLLAGETNASLVLSNVDLWDDWTWVSVSVSNAAGETLWLGPAVLSVYPLPIAIPGAGSMGPAQRYPATIRVRGEPTNGLSRVEVVLRNLRHAYPADLDILLVSPSGAKIMLMSDAGSSFVVTNATLVFHPNWEGYPAPPESSAIPSNQESHYRASNYGEQESQLPGAPPGPYSDDLDLLLLTDPSPNGVWKLYIYDDKTSHTGIVQDSWTLRFYYQ